MVRTYDEAYQLLKPYHSDFYMPIMLAQWALESDYGRSELAVNANNYTGHKTTGWSGKVYKKDTIEYDKNGKPYVAKSEPFRHYDSPQEWAKNHAGWLQRLPEYYAQAINAKSVEEQARALQSTYATDTSYASKLMEKIEEDGLMKYDNKKKGNDKMAYIGIDIGHGKNSPARGGSKGWTGDEHGFNSKVAVRAKALLEAMGHKVTFGVQQPNSNEVGLSPRTQYFNAQKVDILISIHANAHSNTSVNGISAFYDRYGRGRDSASLKLGKSIMDEYRKQGQVIWSTGELPSYRGNWTDFHMNRESAMPSVLLELGFMTGNRDREYVFGSKQPKFVEDMAQGIANGVDKYFGGAGKPVDISNPQGMKTSPMKEFKEPEQPFYIPKVGETVTLAPNFQWADLGKSELLRSFKYDELVGTKDKVIEVKDISNMPKRNHSNYAVKLEKANSWILVEYLVEAKKNWKDGVVEVPPSKVPDYIDDDNYDLYEFELGVVAVRKTDPNKEIKTRPEEPTE